jgi:hypothetical protein
MAPSGSNLERSPRRDLPHHVAKIRRGRTHGTLLMHLNSVGAVRGLRNVGSIGTSELSEGLHCHHRDARHKTRFNLVGCWHNDSCNSGGCSSSDGRQNTPHGVDASVEAKLPHMHDRPRSQPLDEMRTSQHGDRNC